MSLQNSIDFLLENAGASIKRRVKGEILRDLTPEEAATYQAQIMAESHIKDIVACQKPNGWLGNGFHGGNKYTSGMFDNQESGTKYLGEKAVDRETPVLRRAMEAFAVVPLDDLCYRTHGKLFDEFKYAANGQNIIRCACIARAGYADTIDISPQIGLSIDSFRRVLEVDSILDISRSVKSSKYRVFNDFEKWPCRYHLDILAHTDAWKTEENIKTLARAVEKIMRTDNPEMIGLAAASWVGHVLGTVGCFPSQGFALKCADRKTGASYYHMEYIEWLARCGAVPYIPALAELVDEIMSSVDGDGVCRASVDDGMFRGWGTYAGLQLEEDWKSAVRRDCDITFRALLIAHYSDKL